VHIFDKIGTYIKPLEGAKIFLHFSTAIIFLIPMTASSNRYQSRLFSFIHKQSRFLTNRLNRAWKSLQTATSWIAPIVFYPSLPQSVAKKTLLQLQKTPPTVDTPIKQVLLLVDAIPSQQDVATAPANNLLGLLWNKFFPKTNTKSTTNSVQLLKPVDNNSSDSLVQNRPKVQGIASLISNRLLVLVTPHNEILDILTSQQQQVLEARIISEVTNWSLQRLQQSQQNTTPQLPARQSWLLTPVNLFSNIVNWKQRDKLSIFGENAIASIDRHLAKFETENLTPVASKTKGFQIQGLIWAAINYFFGDCTPKLLQPTITNDLAAPWLTMSDLFGSETGSEESLILEIPSISYLPANQNLTPSSQKFNKYTLGNLLNRWQQLTQNNATSLSVKSPQLATNLVKNNQKKPLINFTQLNPNPQKNQ